MRRAQAPDAHTTHAVLPASAAADGTSERVRQALRAAREAALPDDDAMDVDVGPGALTTRPHAPTPYYEVVSEGWVAACERCEWQPGALGAPAAPFRI